MDTRRPRSGLTALAACSLLLTAAGCASLPQKSGVIFAPPSQNSMVVQADTLNLRRCPDTSCPVLALLYRGETVAVRQQQGLWSEIETRRGALGWVASRYLGALQGQPPAGGGPMPAMPEEELAVPMPGNPPEITDELADPAAPPVPAGQPPEISEEFGQ
jgi:uncharacterized protein YraI